jgi:1-aminocyclopropane-1-carboxylate deaminase/D-cysteine desulfhydrase-like pyridoxal-dependent ACC family enzyme
MAISKYQNTSMQKAKLFMNSNRPLLQRYSSLRDKLPFVSLGEFPTPVKPLSLLGERLGIKQLWVKCDDESAITYGGNKIRKLEFLLADARARGCKTVLTFGGIGSNHALATSINCRRLGLDCVAILTPEPATDAVRQTLLYHLQLGTRLEVAVAYADTQALAQRITAELGTGNVYETPFGGSSWVGATGFVNAALELEEQVNTGLLPAPDYIYMGCGTAGSTAGLALGMLLTKFNPHIEAVQVTPDSIKPAALCQQLFEETARKLRSLDTSFATDDLSMDAVNVRRDQLGKGYAMPTAEARDAADMLQLENIPASLTYTAKTMAAIVADAQAGLLKNKNVLFWNTYNSRAYPTLPVDESWQALPEALHHVFTEKP